MVCTTCRAGRTLAEGETPPGTLLYDALAGLIAAGNDAPVTLAEVACLACCERGCACAIAMPGKWTYLLGGLDARAGRRSAGLWGGLCGLAHRRGAALPPAGRVAERACSARVPDLADAGMSRRRERIPGHHRHRLPRRRQNHAGAPCAGARGRAAASPSSSTSSARSASTARRCAAAASRAAPTTTSSSWPMAACAAPWPTISCPTMEALLDRAEPAGAHPHRNLGPGAAEAAAEGVRLAGDPRRA